jgi:hypothetical protein
MVLLEVIQRVLQEAAAAVVVLELLVLMPMLV